MGADDVRKQWKRIDAWLAAHAPPLASDHLACQHLVVPGVSLLGVALAAGDMLQAVARDVRGVEVGVDGLLRR